MSRLFWVAAALVAMGLEASAQTNQQPGAGAGFLPDVTPKKVKTQRLDTKGHALPEVAPAPATPPENSTVALPPPIKVKVYRVEPNGRMHRPGETERWPSWLR